MTEPGTESNRRAASVAAAGFLIQIVTAGALFGVSFWSGSDVVEAAARLSAFGVPIWLILYLVFKQQRRVRTEELETEELKRARGGGADTALFDEVGDEELLIERNRLRWLVSWLMPAGTIVLSLAILITHFVGWGWELEDAFKPATEGGITSADEPRLIMWFVVGCGFVSFLWARYTLALSRIDQWHPLHAGATWMAVNALVCLGVVIALMAGENIEWIEPLVTCAIRILLFVIGLEFAVNYILDLYRPRARTEVPRPSFDSRLLGLVSEPGDIARSIAEAINYQFGFEVSTTWFYQLLQRWMLPLVVVTFIAVVLLTSIVIIDADEQAVIERFGRPWQAEGEFVAGDPHSARVIDPGLHWKFFYPIDVVHRAPVRRTNEIVIGEPPTEEAREGSAILWTEQHQYVAEMLLLVASSEEAGPAGGEIEKKDEQDSDAGKSVAASLLMISVPIEYRVKDIDAYLYNYAEPERVMESVVYQIVSDYASRVEIDQLIGPGRADFNVELSRRFQRKLDELDVGIELVFAGLRGAHPPAEEQVAAVFQKVVSARTNMGTMIATAEGQAQKLLTEAAGSVDRALALDEAIREKDRLEQSANADAERLRQAYERVDALLMGDAASGIAPASGEAAKLIANARERSSKAITEAANKARQFSAEVAAYEASPVLYKTRKRLEIFSDLPFVRKYLIVGGADDIIFEYEDAKEAGLDTVLQEGLEKEKQRTP
jgi:membrane protease subunit HflK